MELAVRHPLPLRLQAQKGIWFVILSAVLIRVFTEQFTILPRGLFNLLDLYLVLVLSGFLLLMVIGFSGRLRTGELHPFLWIYLCVLILSTLVNWERLDWRACGTYWLTNLEGILFFLVFINSNADDHRFHKSLYRLFIFLGFLQVAWILVDGQLFRLMYTSDPDAVSGTFGNNSSQLCFVSIWMIAMALSDRQRLGRRKSWGLVVVFSMVYILPFWRAVWLLFPVVFIATRYILHPRLSVHWMLGLGFKILFWTVVLLWVLVGWIGPFVNSRDLFDNSVQVSGFQEIVNSLFSQINKHPDEWRIGSIRLLEFGKVRSYLDIPKVWEEEWHIALIGTGPGTYNSRAYHTFALTQITGGSAQSGVVYHYSKGHTYRTAISEKYISPVINRFHISGTIGSTLGSYVSNVVEIGLLGFVSWLGIYGRMLSQCRRVYLSTDDPFYKCVSYVAVALFIFTAGISFFDDWFAVGRVMVLLWVFFALVVCEHRRVIRSSEVL